MAVIAVDLGGTNLRTAVIDQNYSIIYSHKTSTRAFEGKEAVISRIKSSIEGAIKFCKENSLSPKAVGICAPGPLIPSRGLILSLPNFPDWRNVPIAEIIAEQFKFPTILENDANAYAYGEYIFGAGKGASYLIVLTLGTGLGSGFVFNGKIFYGAKEIAGEAGHIIIVRGGRKCGCGNKGCLEAYVSATALVKEAIKRATRGLHRTNLIDALQNNQQITAELIAEYAKQGDSLSRKLYNETGRYLGVGLASMINLLNPDRIIIGGGMAEAGEILFNPCIEQARKLSFEMHFNSVSIQKGILGDNAALLGIAGLVRNKLENPCDSGKLF